MKGGFVPEHISFSVYPQLRRYLTGIDWGLMDVDLFQEMRYRLPYEPIGYLCDWDTLSVMLEKVSIDTKAYMIKRLEEELAALEASGWMDECKKENELQEEGLLPDSYYAR